MNPFDEDSGIVYETDNFYVEIGPFSFGDWKGVQGYHIVNTTTGVTESEVNMQSAAIKIANELEKELVAVLQSEDKPAVSDDFHNLLSNLEQP